MVADTRKASNVVFHVKNTHATVALTAPVGYYVFEASIDSTNGTNGAWFGVQAVRSNANTIETSNGSALSVTVGAGAAYSWEASVNAYTFFRVRCITAPSGGTAFWTILHGAYATEPIPAAQITGTQPVSGTLTSAGTTTATPVTGINTKIASLVTTASTNADFIKASAANLYEVTFSNVTATAMYVKFYNKITAPTVGTDIPVATFPVAANTTVTYEFGPVGKRFATGLAIAVTGAAAATDTSVAAAGMQISGTYL